MMEENLLVYVEWFPVKHTISQKKNVTKKKKKKE